MNKAKTAAAISPVMQGVARYIASAIRTPLPKAVVEKTRHHVLDTIAAMVSGSRLLPGRTAISYVKTLGSTPQQFGDYLRSEIPKWEKVVRYSGARVD